MGVSCRKVGRRLEIAEERKYLVRVTVPLQLALFWDLLESF